MLQNVCKELFQMGWENDYERLGGLDAKKAVGFLLELAWMEWKNIKKKIHLNCQFLDEDSNQVTFRMQNKCLKSQVT
jgi:hypothetical protein